MANGAKWSGTVGVERITPILRVSDIQASIAWYGALFGMRRLWGAEPPHEGFGAVGAEEATLMLCEGEQGCIRTWVWIGVEDVERLYERCQIEGVRVVSPPAHYPWAYEMRIEDPDGHILRVGSEPREDHSSMPPD